MPFTAVFGRPDQGCARIAYRISQYRGIFAIQNIAYRNFCDILRYLYLSEPAQPPADPVLYWADTVRIAAYPVLSQLAKKYLSAPATSVESERLFSTAALTLTDFRRSMTPENLEKLLFLKCVTFPWKDLRSFKFGCGISARSIAYRIANLKIVSRIAYR
ncbi:hypothetical protein L596_012251 [Steinernema carpocapsae]|uniref:HAT C-terminal dimerisation domain-containing protein n=1 Tax=Steinernema carpocapsae TaxID=34508 RepID=A0A4V6A4Q4_STECR|nr:hypothetical protein L596_012251 [Steinernema carpocapsae]